MPVTIVRKQKDMADPVTPQVNPDGTPVTPLVTPPPVPPVTTPNPDEGGVYSRMQREKARLEKELKLAQRELEKTRDELGSIENLEDKQRKLDELNRQVFEAEAKVARSTMVENEFPQLKGRDKFIPLGTVDEMRTHAQDIVRDFNLQAPKDSLQSGASGTFTETVERFAELPEAELKAELAKLPDDLKKKYLDEFKARGIL